MTDWVVALWIVAGVLAGAGVLLGLHALFADRSRGRRRCPSCWYDMTGVPGMTCPECGRAARSERRFFRTRRRWKRLWITMLLFVLGVGTGIAPAIYTGEYIRFVPMPILRIALIPFGQDADNALAGSTGPPMNAMPIIPGSAWQRLVLAHGCARALDAGRWRRNDPREAVWLLATVSAALPDEAPLMRPAWARALDSPDYRDTLAIFDSMMWTRVRNLLPEKDLERVLTSSPYEHAREAAARLLLGRSLKSHTNAFMRVARHDEPEIIRFLVCIALARHSSDARVETTVLLDMLRNREPMVVGAAIATLAERSGEPIAWAGRLQTNVRPTPLMRIPFDRLDRDIESYLTRTPAPAPMLDPRVIEPMILQLKNPDPDDRRLAARILKRHAPDARAAVAALQTACDIETDPAAEWAMLDAMAAIEPGEWLTPRVVQFIRRTDSSELGSAILKTAASLGRHASGAISVVREFALRDIAPPSISFPTLRDIGDPKSPVIQQMLDDPRSSTRLSACDGVAAAGYACDYLPTLLKLMGDEESWVRVKAIGAIGGCKSQLLQILPLLAERRNLEPEARIRVQILQLMGSWATDGNPECIGAIKQFLADTDPTVQRAAILQLEQLAPTVPAARRVLEDAARGEKSAVEMLAEESLKRLDGE